VSAPKRAKSKSKGPRAREWHRALRQWPHRWESPGKTAVVGVASVLRDYADFDTGRGARPSLETITFESGATKRSVRSALRQMVDLGWLKVTAEAVPWHRATEYDLVFPITAPEQSYDEASMGAQEHPYDQSPMGAQEHPNTEVAMGARMGARMGAPEHPDLLPPKHTAEEEEESASARSADAPLAALPTSKSKAHRDERLKAALHSVVVGEEAVAIAVKIGKEAGVSLDPGRCGLDRELIEAKERAGWSDADLVAYCVDKLRRSKPKDPTALLATDLRTRVTTSTLRIPARSPSTKTAPKARRASGRHR
jgi:hypothetical protein